MSENNNFWLRVKFLIAKFLIKFFHNKFYFLEIELVQNYIIMHISVNEYAFRIVKCLLA